MKLLLFLGNVAFIIGKLYLDDKNVDTITKTDIPEVEGYFRDLPKTLSCSAAGYLADGEIKGRHFFAMVMELMNKKALKVEKLDAENDYLLSYGENTKNLSEQELAVLGGCIQGEKNKLSDINDYAKVVNGPFASCYKKWAQLVIKEVTDKNKYVELKQEKKRYYNECLFMTLYILFNIIMVNVTFGIKKIIFYILYIIPATIVVLLIFFGLKQVKSMFKQQKRKSMGSKYYFNVTESGQEIQKRCLQLRNFMDEFSRLDEKDLPEVKMWGQYLSFATAFGRADVVNKRFGKIGLSDNIKTYDMVNYNIDDLLEDLNNREIQQTITAIMCTIGQYMR